jgi:co-chaperonin GroES (HSP10)
MQNSSELLGQADQGKDLSSLNESTLPPQPEALEVQAKTDGQNLELTPVEIRQTQSLKRRLELEHGANDLLMAQLTEEPETVAFTVPNFGEVETSPSRIARAITRNRNREELIWYGVTPADQMACMGDRIMVRQDTLEQEHSCRECKGLGYSEEICEVCRGEQKRDGGECPACQVLGYDRDRKWASGRKPCHSCRGTGWRAGIVIPEIAQSKPITGIVVSLGPATNLAKLGDRVLHSKFAGHSLTTGTGETFTVMRESEILSLIRER